MSTIKQSYEQSVGVTRMGSIHACQHDRGTLSHRAWGGMRGRSGFTSRRCHVLGRCSSAAAVSKQSTPASINVAISTISSILPIPTGPRRDLHAPSHLPRLLTFAPASTSWPQSSSDASAPPEKERTSKWNPEHSSGYMLEPWIGKAALHSYYTLDWALSGGAAVSTGSRLTPATA